MNFSPKNTHHDFTVSGLVWLMMPACLIITLCWWWSTSTTHNTRHFAIINWGLLLWPLLLLPLWLLADKHVLRWMDATKFYYGNSSSSAVVHLVASSSISFFFCMNDGNYVGTRRDTHEEYEFMQCMVSRLFDCNNVINLPILQGMSSCYLVAT